MLSWGEMMHWCNDGVSATKLTLCNSTEMLVTAVKMLACTENDNAVEETLGPQIIHIFCLSWRISLLRWRVRLYDYFTLSIARHGESVGAQLVKLSNIQWTLMHLSRPTNWLIGFIQTISLSQIRKSVHGGSDSKYEKKKVPETTATYRYFCHDVRISFILQFFDWYVSKND